MPWKFRLTMNTWVLNQPSRLQSAFTIAGRRNFHGICIAKPLYSMCFSLLILASETRTRRDFSIRSQISYLVSDVKHQKRDRAISLLMLNIRNASRSDAKNLDTFSFLAATVGRVYRAALAMAGANSGGETDYAASSEAQVVQRVPAPLVTRGYRHAFLPVLFLQGWLDVYL